MRAVRAHKGIARTEGLAVSLPNAHRRHDRKARSIANPQSEPGNAHIDRVQRSRLPTRLGRGSQKSSQCGAGCRIRAGLPGLGPASGRPVETARSPDPHGSACDRGGGPDKLDRLVEGGRREPNLALRPDASRSACPNISPGHHRGRGHCAVQAAPPFAPAGRPAHPRHAQCRIRPHGTVATQRVGAGRVHSRVRA